MKCIAALVSIVVLAGCASGTSHVRSLTQEITRADAIAVVALGVVVYNLGNGNVWEAETAAEGNERYRIVLKRALLATGGEGEAGRLFKEHARKVTAIESCQSYRILEYQERLDAHFVGAQRVAEGVIQCVRV